MNVGDRAVVKLGHPHDMHNGCKGVIISKDPLEFHDGSVSIRYTIQLDTDGTTRVYMEQNLVPEGDNQ